MGPSPFPRELDISLASKRPARLHVTTERYVLASPMPDLVRQEPSGLPDASIVVLTHDGLVFSRMCLESVLASTDGHSFELIVVDNASTDGTVDYLHALQSQDRRVRPIFLEENLGFPAGVNLGLSRALGTTFVLLNDDTIVAPGWLTRLVRHLDDPSVGLVGPVTNQAPGAARVGLAYRTYGEFLDAARDLGESPAGREVDRLTLFCAAMNRTTHSEVGPLDDRFEVGMFEDDDYCERIAAAGLRCRLAEDVLVHHFGEASFGRLVADGTWKSIFEANRVRFEEKWGRPWSGHVARDEPSYLELVGRMTAVVATLPDDARVLVASRGDARLCTIPGHTAGHFPQMPDGTYAGHYPADDDAAIQQLVDLGAEGWTHLAVPNPARWWLEHYPLLTRQLERGGVVIDDPSAGIVFRITRS